MNRLFPALICSLCLSFVGCSDSLTPERGDFDFSRGQTLSFQSLEASFVTLEQSPIGNGRFAEHAELVFRNHEDFEAFWHDLHGNLTPDPPLPVVDFENEMVVAVVLGMRNSGGYSVAIERVVQQGNEIGLLVKEVAPGPNCFTPAVITSPYHIIKMNRSTNDLTFVDERQVMACE